MDEGQAQNIRMISPDETLEIAPNYQNEVKSCLSALPRRHSYLKEELGLNQGLQGDYSDSKEHGQMIRKAM